MKDTALYEQLLAWHHRQLVAAKRRFTRRINNAVRSLFDSFERVVKRLCGHAIQSMTLSYSTNLHATRKVAPSMWRTRTLQQNNPHARFHCEPLTRLRPARH